MPYTYKTAEERFWLKVNKTSEEDCWNWTGALQSKGYGILRVDDKRISAHRFSWILSNGNIPNKLLVLHKCDNKRCINPNHLYIGTQIDNMRDRAIRNPVPSESFGSGKTKLSHSDILSIRSIKGKSQQIIASMFNISQKTVSNILRNNSYLCKEGYYV